MKGNQGLWFKISLEQRCPTVPAWIILANKGEGTNLFTSVSNYIYWISMGLCQLKFNLYDYDLSLHRKLVTRFYSGEAP